MTNNQTSYLLYMIARTHVFLYMGCTWWIVQKRQSNLHMIQQGGDAPWLSTSELQIHTQQLKNDQQVHAKFHHHRW
jgi:hypothetical protein